MSLTPHGKILVEVADQAAALCNLYRRKVLSELDDDEHGWTNLYAERADLDDIAAHLAEIARICRSLSDAVLTEGGAQ